MIIPFISTFKLKNKLYKINKLYKLCKRNKTCSISNILLGESVMNLKQFFYSQKHSIILVAITPIICCIQIIFLGAFLYTQIPKNEIHQTGNITIIKDYFITGTSNNINKHVYILLDKDTKLMYLSIDTIQDGKIVATSQSELYNKRQSIMTYKDYLESEDNEQNTLSLNNKVQQSKSNTSTNSTNEE